MATITPDTGARYFSKIFGDNHAAPAFQYIWDSGVVWRNDAGRLQTGAARPVVPGDLSSSINASGLSVSISSVAVTGGILPISDPTSWTLLSGISGALTTNLTAPAYVTGQIAATVTGWNTGIVITAQPNFASTVSSATPSGVSYPFATATVFAGQALAANASRIFFFVQNVSSGTPLYCRLGNSPASATGFSFILNPSQFNGGGGSSFGDDHYRGAVQVSGSAWVAWEE